MHRVSHIERITYTRNRMHMLIFTFPLYICIISYAKLHFFTREYRISVWKYLLWILWTASQSPWYYTSHFRLQSVRNEATKLANRSRNTSRRVYNSHFCLLFFLEKTLTIGLILFSCARHRAIVIIYNNNNKILFARIFLSLPVSRISSLFFTSFLNIKMKTNVFIFGLFPLPIGGSFCGCGACIIIFFFSSSFV